MVVSSCDGKQLGGAVVVVSSCGGAVVVVSSCGGKQLWW